MCWSTRCAADRRRGHASVSTCSMCPSRSGRKHRSCRRSRIPGRTLTPSEWHRRPGKLKSRSDLELIVAAVSGGLSARQRRNVAACRNRSPCMWSYFTSHTRSMRSGSHDRSLPALQRLWPPGMRCHRRALRRLRPSSRQGCDVERVLPQRLELLNELLALRHREGRGDADVMQRALVVEQPEQERPDRCPRRSCASEIPPPRSRPCGRA